LVPVRTLHEVHRLGPAAQSVIALHPQQSSRGVTHCDDLRPGGGVHQQSAQQRHDGGQRVGLTVVPQFGAGEFEPWQRGVGVHPVPGAALPRLAHDRAYVRTDLARVGEVLVRQGHIPAHCVGVAVPWPRVPRSGHPVLLGSLRPRPMSTPTCVVDHRPPWQPPSTVPARCPRPSRPARTSKVGTQSYSSRATLTEERTVWPPHTHHPGRPTATRTSIPRNYGRGAAGTRSVSPPSSPWSSQGPSGSSPRCSPCSGSRSSMPRSTVPVRPTSLLPPPRRTCTS